MYEVTTEQDNLLIRFPRHDVDEEDLIKLLDYLEMESIQKASKLNEEDARELSSTINKAAWNQTSHLFTKD